MYRQAVRLLNKVAETEQFFRVGIVTTTTSSTSNVGPSMLATAAGRARASSNCAVMSPTTSSSKIIRCSPAV